MKGKMYVIPADILKPIETLELTAPPRADSLHTAVGGYIESVPYFTQYAGEKAVAFCNEEGKLEGLPINPRATRLWWDMPIMRGHEPNDILVGDVVVITGDEELFREL